MKLLKKILFILALILVILLGIWIGRENSQEITFTLLGFQLPSLKLGMFAAWLFLIAISLGVFLTLPSFLKYRTAARRYKRRLLEAEAKLAKNSIQQR